MRSATWLSCRQALAARLWNVLRIGFSSCRRPDLSLIAGRARTGSTGAAFAVACVAELDGPRIEDGRRTVANGSINHTLRDARISSSTADSSTCARCRRPATNTIRRTSAATSSSQRSRPPTRKLAEIGIAPIGRVTFHSLRRSYASLRCASGDDIRYTADQLGHADPRFTLRVYAQATKRRDRLSGPHLKAYDQALEWAHMGTGEPLTVPTFDVQATKNPV